MTEVTIKIPAELEEELKPLPRREWSLLVNKALKEKLERAARFRRIISKSKMTQEQADKLAEEINRGMAKRYEKLLSK